MLILLEYLAARRVAAGEQRIRLCPVCGQPFEPDQLKLGYLDRATSGYYEVHDGCETGLASFIEAQEVSYDGDLLAAS